MKTVGGFSTSKEVKIEKLILYNNLMPAKRTVYLLLAMLLGMTLGDIVYDVLEVSYLNSLIVDSNAWYAIYGERLLALRPLPEIVFDLAGVFGGYYAGKSWWRIIYIEDRRHKGYKLDW